MKTLSHQFVEFMPESLEDGVLYISLRFCLVTHKCCCGCREEVVLKLSPKDWNLTFDGETISISPSIGNWSLNCQSHYWIRNSCVKWVPRWPNQENVVTEPQRPKGTGKKGFWSKLWRRAEKK